MRSQGFWAQWVYRPQRIQWRRALLQIHLWLALTLGLYVVVISISGSAVVFRAEFGRTFIPQTVPSTEGTRLEGDALRSAMERVYVDYTVVRFGESRHPSRPVSVLLERDGEQHGRLFDPYAVLDMGESYPRVIRVVEWLVSLHDDLLAGTTGRKINGIAGALVLLIVVSGAIIWWPGKQRWRRSLIVTPSMNRFVWHLHSAVGFWALLLLANWALTGVYMAFPGPFEAIIDRFDSNLDDFVRPGEGLVRFLVTAHFGRFGGLEVRIAWVLLGLLPVVLFVSGFILWWRRVLKPRLARVDARPKTEPAA